MNNLTEGTLSENQDTGQHEPVLHTDDVREDFQQYISEQKDALSNIKENLDLKTGDLLEVISKTALQSRYELITQNVGTVKKVGDGVAIVSGLHGVMENELVMFPDGTFGIAMDLHEFYVGCVILGSGDNIQAGDMVYETGREVDVPVGKKLLGRVVNALGQPIDGLGPLETDDYRPVEFPAQGFIYRSPIDTPLQTGIKAIDAIIPLGKGQRELIIGDRQTGKSAIAVDTVINQKGQDVYCIYVCIGQKMSTVAQTVDTFREHGALEYTTIVTASPEDSPSLVYIAPYAGCAIAEAFMYSGHDALVIYDDLSKHAVAYRQLSLLLERPAGREAYPGDIFYLHSRLLERSAKLSRQKGGGSMTALPIVETQAGNISAYIPTNLISITDGQIYLSTKLFDEGLLPAIDIGLSVSRVGGSAQNDAMRAVSKSLALDVAQYLELRIFSRFGTELDTKTRHQLERGEKIRAVLTQPQFEPLPAAHQVAIIYAAIGGYLDKVPLNQLSEFEKLLIKHLKQYHAGLLAEFTAGHWQEELKEELKESINTLLERLYDSGFLQEVEEIEI
ncbi:MAG: F0F1 ATP synthase subunit alpha [Chloroflexota bacterium]|nr:F0F1 ATP synthase subunit alpha [Chloroflexota bacterium]